jgi:hypothetical protein
VGTYPTSEEACASSDLYETNLGTDASTIVVFATIAVVAVVVVNLP